MIRYLLGGWYGAKRRTRLRTEVIDGAMDVAGALVRAGVPAHRVLRIGLKVRSLVVIADPLMTGGARFGARERQAISQRLAQSTDGFPELQSFIIDCIEHVNNPSDMVAFYLHLVHITRIMQLLAHATSATSPPAKSRRRRRLSDPRR